MRTQFEHDYPPLDWTPSELARTLEAVDGSVPLPQYNAETTWQQIKETTPTDNLANRIISEAANLRDKPIPPLPASRYLEYHRTGNRSHYQDPERRRRYRLSMFFLAECLEREGHYLDHILDYAWAICEQATWVLPAHLPDDGTRGVAGLPCVVHPAEDHVALRPAGLAKVLSDLDYVLGEQLHPALRERIRAEVERRVITPFETRDDFSWQEPPTSNWNAVCNAGPAVAALTLLDDNERIASIVLQSVQNMRHYLADFDSAGCTAEGIGYWNYGFGNFVQLGVHLAARTEGAFDLLSVPIVEAIAGYPLEVELSPGHYLPFSDAYEQTWPHPYILCRLGERFDRPALIASGRQALEDGTPLSEKGDHTLRTLAWCAGVPAPTATPYPRRRFLDGYDWWLANADPDEQDGLVVAAKGGHNGEAHNHNDCGSFIVHRNGESLLTDLGKPTYTGSYFSADRYEHLAARSLGHSVPYVTGHEQAAGSEHAAVVTDRTSTADIDAITFDLARCYPAAADVERLTRTVRLDRTRETVTIDDAATFPDTGRFESVLVSYFPMTTTDGEISIEGRQGTATVVPDGATAIEVDRLADAIDRSGHKHAAPDLVDVWRARIGVPAAEVVSLSLSITC